MKKKSILLLLLTFVTAMVIGLVGCTSSSTTKVDFEDIQAKNALQQVLTDNTNVVISASMPSLGQGAEICFSKTEDGELLVDEKLEGEMSASIIGGATYVIYGDEEFIEICPNADHTACLEMGYVDLATLTLDGDVTVEGDDCLFTAVGEEMTFKCVADKESLLLESVEIVVNMEGTEIAVSQLTYQYNVEIDWQGEAYKALTTADDEEDLRNFELRINPLTEDEQIREYVVRKGVEIDFGVAENGDTYYFYKNVSCTQDIESLAEILEIYDDVRIYATNTHVEISFDFLLTEDDVTDFADRINNFITLAETGTDYDEIEFARELMEDKMSYFVHQYYMGQVKYYTDITNQEGIDAFDFAVETYNDAYVDYIDAYKTVYEMTDNEYSLWLFEDWTEEDLAIFEKDNETISALEERNSEIEKEFNDLKSTSSTWSEDVEALYEEFVANNQQIATLNGFDNAYDYLCDNYSRFYTDEERENLKKYIAQYVIPYVSEAKSKYNEVQSALSSSDKQEKNDVLYSNISVASNKTIKGYIESYDNDLREAMSALYEKKAGKFATSTSSMGTAFANYSGYYEEAFTFFGKDYQDVLTFIHELGHYVSFSSYPAGMPYDFAETHSQGNEWMLLYYLKGNVKNRVQKYLVYENLYNALSLMIRGMIVDEFEYRVYTAETPYSASEYKDVMIGVLTDFGMSESALKTYYQNYAQIVTLLSPGYYLNYVTSSMVAISFYTVASEQGYEVAQEIYRKLQQDCDISMSYAEIVKSIGIPSPFEEEAYLMMIRTFFPEA